MQKVMNIIFFSLHREEFQKIISETFFFLF